MAFLSSLQSLYLGINSLSNTLPVMLDSYPSLSNVDLSSNSLSGALPTSIWNLYDHLVSLYHHYNNFFCAIPNSAIPNSSCDRLQPTFFLTNSTSPPPSSETMTMRFKKNQKKQSHVSTGHSRIGKHQKHPDGHGYRIQDCHYSPHGHARRRPPHRWSHYGRPSHPEPHLCHQCSLSFLLAIARVSPIASSESISSPASSPTRLPSLSPLAQSPVATCPCHQFQSSSKIYAKDSQ